MAGIVSFGAYVPIYRMDRAEFHRAWAGFPIPGESAIASYDEDTITMAVEAATDCLRGFDRQCVDALFLATTTCPYREKLGASIVATALDLSPGIRTMDITGTLRAGTTALAAALDAINARSARNVLVVASDCRLGAPSGMLEPVLGSGAAALLIGTDDVIAEIEGQTNISDEFSGVWRSHDDIFVRSWEDRMTLEKGYSAILPEVIKDLMQKYDLAPDSFDKLVIDAPSNITKQAAVAKKLDLDPAKLQDTLFLTVGNTGAALASMMFVAALEEAAPNQTMLYAAYGNGADAFLLRTTAALAELKPRRGIKRHIESKLKLSNYETYLRWNGIIPLDPGRRPDPPAASLTALHRHRREILALYGARCLNCGTPQYVSPSALLTTGVTPIRICAACHAKDRFEPYRFADKQATVFTFTQDNLAAGMNPPATIAVIDFDGGGRALFDVTDCDPSTLAVNMRMEMTFRKMFTNNGIHNYYWKTRPIRCKDDNHG